METASIIREDDAWPVGQALADAPGLSPAAVRSLKEDVMETRTPLVTGMTARWNDERPRVLVVACSDGRLQEITDEFLLRVGGITCYDRLYVPGGIGALSASGRDFMRAQQLQQECKYLVQLHRVEHVIALFHGPAPDGPTDAVCADYRRKFEW